MEGHSMSAIVEFLRARLAEDEAVAREALAVEWADEDWPAEVYDDGVRNRAVAYSPRRALREAEARWAIVDEHGGRPPYHVDPCDAHDATFATIPCDTLRFLAAVYSDHPDYRDEWRP